MKRWASLAAATMAASLVTAAGPADAAPYPGAVPTTVVMKAKFVQPRGYIEATGTVNLTGGTGTATTGAIQVICRTNFHGLRRVTRTGPLQVYTGGTQFLVGPKLRSKRLWGCFVKYDGGTSVFASNRSRRFVIRTR